MKKQYDQVKQFHEACGVEMPEVPTMLDTGPFRNSWLGDDLAAITDRVKAINSIKHHGKNVGGEMATRVSYMLEELTELSSAETAEDQADALIDLMYFALGTFTLMGVNPEPLFDIVQAANMGKVGEDGKVMRNEQGKIMKPDGWHEKFAPEAKLKAEIELQSQIKMF